MAPADTMDMGGDMIVIGITGGVGAGKSQVMNYLQEAYDAAVILADEVGHLVMKRGEICFDPIVSLFGEGVVGSDGELDRKAIAEIVFHDPEQLKALNRIVHPAVKQWILREIDREAAGGRKVLFLECALLFEEKYNEKCDELWYVYAEDSVRIQRLKTGRGYTEEKSLSVMRNQMSDDVFRVHCHCVIDNSGDFAETRKQLDQEMQRISKK